MLCSSGAMSKPQSDYGSGTIRRNGSRRKLPLLALIAFVLSATPAFAEDWIRIPHEPARSPGRSIVKRNSFSPPSHVTPGGDSTNTNKPPAVTDKPTALTDDQATLLAHDVRLLARTKAACAEMVKQGKKFINYLPKDTTPPLADICTVEVPYIRSVVSARKTGVKLDEAIDCVRRISSNPWDRGAMIPELVFIWRVVPDNALDSTIADECYQTGGWTGP